MPCRWTVGRTSSSMPRTRIEYGGCSVTNRSRPRSRAAHWASTIWLAGVGRGPDVADLALADEIGEGAEGLLDIGVRAGPVHLVEVDVVGAQPAQRVLDLAHDPAAGPAAVVGLVAHRHEELGGQDDVVAAALQGLADDLLGHAAGVDVGGVDEVDPGVEGAVDDPDGVGAVVVAPRPEHHRAQAQRADRYAGPAEHSVLHGQSHLSRLLSYQRLCWRVSRWDGPQGLMKSVCVGIVVIRWES